LCIFCTHIHVFPNYNNFKFKKLKLIYFRKLTTELIDFVPYTNLALFVNYWENITKIGIFSQGKLQRSRINYNVEKSLNGY